MQFIIFDFEVFEKDWIIVLKPADQEEIVIANDSDALKQFYNDHKNDIFVGYNNRHYDDHIFKGILSDLDPKKINDWIIEDKKSGWSYPDMKRFSLLTMDLMQDVLALSLKEAEGNLGLSIEESSVDFTIDRKLTDEELQEVIGYCKHDVFATETLMKARKDYLMSKFTLISMYNLPLSDVSKTSAQISASILGARKKSYHDEMYYDRPIEIQLKDQEILDNYISPLDYNRTLKKTIAGVEHTIAYGGLHGAKKGMFEGNLLSIDVASYYPAMIIEYDYMSRSCHNKNKYKEVRDLRLDLKKKKDFKQNALKIVLNATYGCMKNQYNPLYDPKQCNQICITGQLFLLDLIEKIEPYCELIQSNTDGLVVRVLNREKLEDEVHKWEDRTKMVMEFDNVSKIIQKDVNNYIMIMENGKIKVKGGYVRNYEGGNFQQNSLTIVDEAVVKYFTENIPIEDTINSCNDLIRFQNITKKGPTYTHVTHTVDGREKRVNNVNRVFATKDEKFGTLHKHKIAKGVPRKDKNPGVPEHCIVCNDSIDKYDINLIDKDWYINVAQERINDYLKEV